MSGTAVALVLVSTVLHAGWNLLGKEAADRVGFFDRMLAIIAGIGLAPALFVHWFSPHLSPGVLACAVVSGLFCGGYYLFLMLGYASGDFSLVYPVARALPVLILGVADALRGRPPTSIGWLGMFLVTAGCVLAPQTSFREMSFRVYRGRVLAFIGLTAMGTVGYTLVDKIAAEHIVSGGPAAAAIYGYVFFVATWGFFRGFLRLGARWDPTLSRFAAPSPSAARHRWKAWTGAGMNFGAYWLVLWAYQLAARASYIVAFRQFSIVLGVAAALFWFRERGAGIRMLAAGAITAGVILLGLRG